MIEQYLWIAGAAIFLVLGSLHLYYTFFTNKFLAKNEEAVVEMKNTHPRITRETTMWKAWIGFNASHSAGAMFIGAINILLAARHFVLLQSSSVLMALTIVASLFYLWLGKKYWFRIPFIGVLIPTLLFITSFIISRL